MLTRIMQVLSAFVGTESATRGAGETGEANVGSAIAQVGNAQQTGEETLAARPIAVGHFGYAIAEVEATVARSGAGYAGFDTSLELVTVHGKPVGSRVRIKGGIGLKHGAL